MIRTAIKFGSAIALISSASLAQAARDPSISYSAQLQNVKLQHPGSSDEVCESNSSYPSCVGFHESGLWWMENSSTFVVHKINGDDPDRNELRNKKEFNAKTSSKTFKGTLKKVSTSGIKHVTVLQLHRSVSGSKPVMRIQYDRSNDRYEYEVTLDASASRGYCKGVFSTSGSGSKWFQLKPVNKDGKRQMSMKLAGETHYCDLTYWPSESKYYYKMGTYLSDGDGYAEFKFKNWSWNQ